MAYVNVYPSRINWENEPSINTPINAVNLNKIDYAVYEHDQTLANWDTTKANQSDLLLSVKTIDFDPETGIFIFTWQNGTTKTVDLNVEKIPVSFSMDANGVITMTNADGTTYTADVSALIKTYTFVDSDVIDFTVVTDPNGNKTVMADIVDGSITGTKLQPNYLADCQEAKTGAETAESNANDSAEDSEAWANGTRGGVPVSNTDPTYENNAKYWAQQANPTALANMSDVDLNSPTDGQVFVYNSTTHKWENRDASGGAEIDDTTTSTTKVWSSQKVSTELSTKLSYADNAILGAKNLLPNNAVSQTVNGITFTVNSDGSVTANGTATAVATIDLISSSIYITDGILTGCSNGGGENTYLLAVYDGTSWYGDYGEGVRVTNKTITRAVIQIKNGVDASGLTFYPMLRLATDTDDTYVPYAKTNKELTDAHKVTNILVDITSGWTQDIISQSGTTLYKKQVSLNHVYTASPTVEIGAASGSVLPTVAQQTTYDYLRYVTVDDTVPCIYLYADENMMSDSDRTSFYIDIEGVD